MRRVKASQNLWCPDGEVFGYYLSWCRGVVDLSVGQVWPVSAAGRLKTRVLALRG